MGPEEYLSPEKCRANARECYDTARKITDPEARRAAFAGRQVAEIGGHDRRRSVQASLGQSGPEPLPGGVEFGEVTQRSWSICSEAADQIGGCCSGGATLHSSERLPRGHPNNFHTCTIRHHPARHFYYSKLLASFDHSTV